MPNFLKSWPVLEFLVSIGRTSFSRSAASTAGHSRATIAAVSRISASASASCLKRQRCAMLKLRSDQCTSSGRCFMFKSPARNTDFPADRARCIADLSACSHFNLKGMRGPPDPFGTYTLNKTKEPWSVMTQRPSVSSSGDCSGAGSARLTKPFRANVATPFRPCRCCPPPSLQAQKLSNPSRSAPKTLACCAIIFDPSFTS
mmetsp:Transcript_8127/g.18119  ORF Transcript_8127/g.18119 Transcript_8127/m.18119 type:complete len:202 (+) Transcript_8127:952-1557(+)